MSGFTRLSCLIWEWERWNKLSSSARLLWMALYTSPTAKRGVPALWQGSVVTMAESARLPLDESVQALDVLLEHELAEYDPKKLVLRLTELPDAGEWPSNPFILESWYKRFLMVPECGVRDAHVTTIRWILERGALEASKNRRGKPSRNHEQVWTETFGNVQIPSPRRRGVRRFADNNDTANEFQTSLFQSPSGASLPTSLPTYPQVYPPPVDNFHQDPNPNNINGDETLLRGYGEGEGEGEGDLFFSSSGETGGSGPRSRPPSPELPDLGATVRAERDQGPPATGKPVLVLVPPTGPFTVDQLIAAISLGRGHRVTETQYADLQRAISSLGTVPVGIDVLAVLAEYGPRGLSYEQVIAQGAMRRIIQNAFARKRQSEESAAMLAEAKKAGPYTW